MTVDGEGSAPEVRLPRMQQGAQPQHLLITLLGDYWLDRNEPLPSAALVALLGEFGISQVAARAALSRLARRGLLRVSKEGRRSYYAMTGRASEMLKDGAHRIMSFGRSAVPGTGSGGSPRSPCPRGSATCGTPPGRGCAGRASPRSTTACGSLRTTSRRRRRARWPNWT
nr:hypothetical protein [Actinomadura sp. CNU-125]